MNTKHIHRPSLILLLTVVIFSFPSVTLSEEEAFVHRAPVDTVQWISRDQGVVTPPMDETHIEGPGEQLGLIGPILATGGKGDKEFIAIYDAAGVLVATISKKRSAQKPG